MDLSGKTRTLAAPPAQAPATYQHTIALAGNPNVGKSTVFNKLTGLNQHTGNWPGKTVAQAQGSFSYRGHNFTLVDLPGAYSLDAASPEEEVTREYICFQQPPVTVVVADATCLERNLNLVLQIKEICPRVIVCVNLLDEAKKKQIHIDFARLSAELELPVIGTSARRGEGLTELKEQVYLAAVATAASAPPRRHRGHEAGWAEAERIYRACTRLGNNSYTSFDRRLDKIVTSRITGIPIMLALLALVLWITISGANYPSALLSTLFRFLEQKLDALFLLLNAPVWLHGLLVQGMYRTLSWVVSVMLPPMAIFFPLFTLLEDSGYLPRVAFNMDNFFKHSGACGKQCLTTLMGFGCNACGVTGCRIINSPRERLLAILTNNFIPCNGRFAPPRKGQQNCSLGPTKKRDRHIMYGGPTSGYLMIPSTSRSFSCSMTLSITAIFCSVVRFD